MERNTTMIEYQNEEISYPCMEPKFVSVEKIRANNYNPNNVPKDKLELLAQSIIDNGFCYPVMTIYDSDDDLYIIIDGFHRFTILKNWFGQKKIPIIVLEHDLKKRMSATIQFNRARGIHQTELMGDLVQTLVEQGMNDEEIGKHLGMELEEVYRLKQITGIAELFKNQKYSTAWEINKEEND